MKSNVVLVNARDGELATAVRAAGLQVVDTWTLGMLGRQGRERTVSADLLIVDVRAANELPVELAVYKRQHPSTRVLVIASQLSVEFMRDAMRAGVTECLGEPFSADELAAAAERAGGAEVGGQARAKVLVFAGAKEGVGTTMVAVNVAAAIATTQHGSVVYLDLHTQDPGDAALYLGVEPLHSVAEALHDVRRLDGAYIRGLVTTAPCGLDVIAAPVHPIEQPPAPDDVKTLVHWLAAHYDYIVVDLPRVEGRLLDALEPVAMFTLVLSQELATVRRAVDIAALLRPRYGSQRSLVVINRYDAGAEIGHDDIEHAIKLPVGDRLPSDYRQAITAANTGKPIVTRGRSRLAKSLIELAEHIARGAVTRSASAPAASLLTGAVAGLS